MKQFNIELVRRDKVKVELDPEFFNEEWFAEFRHFFYGKRPYWLKKDEEVNEHVNVIYNSYDTEIEYE